jgi:hypothetical protein
MTVACICPLPFFRFLIPKGPNVRMADKPVLVSVTWAHNTFCEDASRHKLHRKKKSYCLDLQIKNYGCLKFLGEVWARRACAGANEEELTTCGKIWGQRGRKEGAGGLDKGGPAHERSEAADRAPTSGRWSPLTGWPLVTWQPGDQQSPTGREPLPPYTGRGIFNFF